MGDQPGHGESARLATRVTSWLSEREWQGSPPPPIWRVKDAGIIRPMLRDLGISIEFIPSPVSVGVEDDIVDVDSVASLEAYQRMLEWLYPENANDIISQHFFKSTPAFFAMSYFSLYLDYIYPKNGTGALPESLRAKVIEHGGTIITGSVVDEVDAHGSYARDSHGDEYAYQSLIWAADLKKLYRATRTDGLSSGAVRRREAPGEIVAGPSALRPRATASIPFAPVPPVASHSVSRDLRPVARRSRWAYHEEREVRGIPANRARCAPRPCRSVW